MLGCDISVGVSNVGVIMCSVAMSNDRILFVQWLLVCVCVFNVMLYVTRCVLCVMQLIVIVCSFICLSMFVCVCV